MDPTALTYAAYNLATSLALLPGAGWLATHPHHRALWGRFAPPVPSLPEPPIWVQACSVGEVGVARPILSAMHQRWPGIPLLLTVSTKAGWDLAKKTCPPGVSLTWCPFDHSCIVRSFLAKAVPRALVLLETELWPNILRETRRAGAPVLLLNGRLSDKHYPRYTRFRTLLRPVLNQLSAAGLQNEEYAERLRALNPGATNLLVTGNTKFDGVKTAVDQERLNQLRSENGLPTAGPILLFGSTRPGDEALAAACWSALEKEFPNLCLVVAPRHVDRIDEVLACFNEPVLRRSHVRDGRAPAGERIFILDTVGELADFYAIATLAVIGGSFYPGVNGHNPLEPAALGIPTLFGPYMRNFIDPAQVLVDHKGALQVDAPRDLLPALRSLLQDDAQRARIAEHGREAIMENQGAITRSLDLLETLLA